MPIEISHNQNLPNLDQLAKQIALSNLLNFESIGLNQANIDYGNNWWANSFWERPKGLCGRLTTFSAILG